MSEGKVGSADAFEDGDFLRITKPGFPDFLEYGIFYRHHERYVSLSCLFSWRRGEPGCAIRGYDCGFQWIGYDDPPDESDDIGGKDPELVHFFLCVINDVVNDPNYNRTVDRLLELLPTTEYVKKQLSAIVKACREDPDNPTTSYVDINAWLSRNFDDGNQGNDLLKALAED